MASIHVFALTLLSLCLGEHVLELLDRKAEIDAWLRGQAKRMAVIEEGIVDVECFRHLRYRCTLGLGIDFGVSVECHRNVRVPKVARHGSNVGAACDHHGGKGMAQVVERALEGVHLAECLELAREARGVEDAAA